MLWPVACPLCEAPLTADEPTLCLECLVRIPRIRKDRLIPFVGVPGNVVIERSWFVYSHDDPSHRLIHDIKYHDRIKLARRLGREFAMQKLLDCLPIDVILPIPLHWTKLVSRGYNQTYQIALGIRDVVGIPVGKNLYALRPHTSQTLNTRDDRNENVRGIFAVKHPETLNGRHVALLDDVITTGATMFSALDSLLKVCAPASVTFLSLARTGSK